MPEPSKTSGRPLAPHIKQEQQPQGNSITSLPPLTRNKQRKLSQSSDDSSGGAGSYSTIHRPGATSKASLESHTGSSCSKQKSTARLDYMSSHMSPVHYTRTGRVSKAKKGLKVHNCECGRSYTRAEHLRRHQKNHAQDDAIICDFPDCGKIFYRIDLLHRHQERHNETDKESRQASVFSAESSPQVRQNSISVAGSIGITTTVPHTPTYYPTLPVSPIQDTSAVSSHKQQGPFMTCQPVAVGVPLDGPARSLAWPDAYSQSPGYSSSTSGYASPIPGPGDYNNVFGIHPYSHGSNRTRTSSNASFIEPWSYTPRSPVSTNSTMPYTWAPEDKTATSLAYIAASYPMTTMGMTTGVETMSTYGQFGPKTMMQRDDDEGVVLFPEHYGMGQIAHNYPLEQFLNNYWRLFHPTFPVIHRPTFERMSKPPPMLHAAMIAIGGQYSDDMSAKRRSRDLHDRCIKLLEKRDHEPMTQDERLADYQSIFLIEVLSQHRARRAAKTLSPRFGTVYHKATEDYRQRASHISEIFQSLECLVVDTSACWIRWIDLSAWQHLLVSCYILESQQAILLAREPHPSMFSDSGIDLLFPVHQSLWDCKDFEEWASQARNRLHAPQYVFEIIQGQSTTSHTAFQSALLIATIYNRFGMQVPYVSAPLHADISHLVDGSFITQQNLLTAKLVQVTPIRALLAVSGESWILSEKVASQQTFAELKAVLRTWVYQLWSSPVNNNQHSPVKEALSLSIQLLQLAMDAQLESVPLEMGSDMGLYFAALILWAITLAATIRTQHAMHLAQQVSQRRFSNSAGMTKHNNPPRGLSTPVLQGNYLQNLGGSTSSSSSSSELERVSSQPASPRRDSLSAPPLLSYEQISLNSKSFLSSAIDTLSTQPQLQNPLDLNRVQAGCISLLLWVKLHLRGAPLKDEGGLAVWAGRPGEGLGELLDSVVGSLERVLNRGWTNWGI